MINDTIDQNELVRNPALFAPSNMFEKETTQITPGKIISYKVGIQDPNAIIPIKLGNPDVSLFQVVNDKLEDEATGFSLALKTANSTVEKSATEIVQSVITDSIIINRLIDEFVLFIIFRFVEDVFNLLEIPTQNIKLKTCAELNTQKEKANSLVGLLNNIASADPSMINLKESSGYVFDSYGFDASKFLNDDKNTHILQSVQGIDQDVLQQALQQAQQEQVKKNAELKAQKMMSQVQDNVYRSTIKDAWKQNGQMPESVQIPNGQDVMEVPVVSTTPNNMVKNRVLPIGDGGQQ